MTVKNKKGNEPSFRINGDIYITGSPMVRLVFEDGTSAVCHINEARHKAEEAELDLVEISPNANPPVVKIVNYQKMLYELKKNARKQQHNAKPLKEVQLSVSIAENDLKVKANNARKFLLDGSKVKVVLSMRGREKARREENKKSIYQFIKLVKETPTFRWGRN